MRLSLAGAATVLALSLAACGGGPGAQAQDSPEEAVVRQWVAALNAGDADAAIELFGPEVETRAGPVEPEQLRPILENFPCGGDIETLEQEGTTVTVTLRVTEREGATCPSDQIGNTRTFTLEVEDGQITGLN